MTTTEYQKEIAKIVADLPLTDKAKRIPLRYLQAWMCVTGCLSGMTSSEFRKEVIEAVGCAMTSTGSMNEKLARSYGL